MKQKQRKIASLISTSLLALMLPGVAFSHATLVEKHGVVGSTLKNAIQIGHGCSTGDGHHLATKKLIMDVPDGVHGARAYNKAGWKIKTIKGPVTPYMSRGNLVTEDTVRIMWKAMNKHAAVANELREEFWFQATLPEKAAMSVYFPATQVCDKNNRVEWVEIPGDGMEPGDLPRPAPRIVTTPSGL